MPPLPALLITLFLTVVLPVLAAVVLARRDRGCLSPFLLGAATFGVAQYLLRMPLLRLLLQESLGFLLFSRTQPVWYALFLALTAALFEEGGRYLVMRCIMKRRGFLDGVAFGVGHGGMESILLIGLPALSLLASPQEISGAMVLLSGAERVFTMVIHVAFSVMVLRAARRRRIGGLLLAFALHTALNFIALLMQNQGLPIYLTELFILGFMSFMVGYLLYVKSKVEEDLP